MSRIERKLPPLDIGSNRDVSDMPVQPPLSPEQIDEIEAQELGRAALKARLPMLFTARGNVIKSKTLRISAKNFAEINHRISGIEMVRNRPIVIRGETWTLTLSHDESNMLRSYGLVGHLILNGWDVTLG
jgi:hypothetical protein